MQPYKHIVQYYETDKMGITHHSNYIRWMEEARIDFLKQLGWDYAKLEEMGVISPVTEINCKYKQPTTFSDEIFVMVNIAEYNGIRLKLSYKMKNSVNKTVFEGKSEHCFVNKEGRIVRVKKEFPEFDAALAAEAEETIQN